MRIAIDGSAIPLQMAGAGVYTYQLTRALDALQSNHQFVVLTRPGLFDDLQNTEVVHVRRMRPALRLAWEQTVLPVLLRRHRIDLLHSPHHHTPTIVGPGIVRTVTFNDVTFMLLPDRYPRVRRIYMEAVTRAAARVARAIITPSEAARTDVVEQLGVESKISVVPDAAGPQYRPAPEHEITRVRDHYGIAGPYVVSVSSLEPGKNRSRLIQAFASVHAERPDVSLVIVGRPAWDYESDRQLIGQLGLSDAIIFTGYVPDDDLPSLYSGAELLAYPSLYEGFGLPILESMACDTPVVTSNVGATAEVAGDAALLVDPLSVESISSATLRLLNDANLQEDLRVSGQRRAGEFSWKHTAQETLAVYERTVSS